MKTHICMHVTSMCTVQSATDARILSALSHQKRFLLKYPLVMYNNLQDKPLKSVFQQRMQLK